ncbi:hypothetical protein FOA52_002492 [Chlamydomonas sp. UWO 241]|nr:hypothetical protein FOA52_002492 [Chlamydomonas sp. UWO 241]
MATHGGLIFRGSTFAADGRTLLSPSGTQLKLFSASTAELVGSLSHDADITAVAPHPKEPGQVYTASKDGTIRLWDYHTRECIKTLHVREAVRGMVFCEDLPIAYLSINWKDGSSGRIITFDLEKGRAGRTAMKTSAARTLVAAGGGAARTFVATSDRHTLFVWRTGEEMTQPLVLHHTKPYTCVAVSADETMLAAGDATGRIQLWRHFGDAVPRASSNPDSAPGGSNSGGGSGQPSSSAASDAAASLRPATLHWHASAVGCLSYSPDGTYLLSGGREGVLVLWQVENGSQNFLPRLGGPLVSIRPSPVDPARYLVSQADNTLRVVNTASMKVESSVLGLRPLPAGLPPRASPSATLLQPGTGHLVVPCESAEMQLYDTVHNRHVAIVKVVPRNYVSMPADAAKPSASAAASADADAAAGSAPGVLVHASLPHLPPYVSHAAFTPNGSCLVTVDMRPDAGAYRSSEACLKFWDVTGGGSSAEGGAPALALNTRVDDPHTGIVSAVACHPSADVVATCGGDAEFRLWVHVPTARAPGGRAEAPSAWRVRARGAYRGLPLTAVAFSTDGSVLAVAAGSKVTLWDPVTCGLAAVLSLPHEHAASGASIWRLAFLPGSRHLVGATNGVLCVWDVASCALAWALDGHTTALAADPVHACFAVAVPAPASSSRARQQQHEAQQKEAAAGASASAAPGGAVGKAGAAPAPGGGASGWRASTTQHMSHVLVFDAASPVPRLAAAVPGTLCPALLYVRPGLPQHAAAAAGLPERMSPLLVLTESRTYTYVGGEGGGDGGASAAPAAASTADEPSAFEAAFGSLGQKAPGAAGADAGAAAMDVDVATGGPRWRKLFDAPSHALPPPTTLAQAFLQLVTSSD